MKIAFLSDDFPPESFGGAGISTYELAKGLSKNGHTVSVITTTRKKEEEGVVIFDNITVHKIADSYDLRWRFYRNLNNGKVVQKATSILKEIRPDVVHANNIHIHLSFKLLREAQKYAKVVFFTARDTVSVCFGKLATKRYVENLEYNTTLLDHLNIVGKQWNPFYTAKAKNYLNSVTSVFAVSNSLKQALTAHGVKNVKVMHTGGDSNMWNVSKEELEAFKEKHTLSDKKVLLFGGRLSTLKGGDSAILALSKIVEKEENTVLLVAGAKDVFAAKMLESAQELGVANNIVFTGWLDRSEMKRAYAASDVVLVLSKYLDPFPRIAIEGMSAGKPIIATKYGGASEIVEDGKNGYVLDPRDVDSIANRASELLQGDAKRKVFGKASKEIIDLTFNLSDKIALHEKEYKIHINGER